ncbi:MAG: DUF1173 domain-containing protein [Comamonadaceae bacterium]|nr:DUF1173 domain-containing protein [Comamonadaceae bacterium]
MKEIVAHADRLQATRIVAVGEDGSRTPIHKIGDQWERQPTLRPQPPAPDQVVDDKDPQKKPASTVPSAKRPPQACGAYRVADGPRTMPHASAPRSRGRTGGANCWSATSLKRPLVTVGDVTDRHAPSTAGAATPSASRSPRSAFKLSTDNDNPSVARSMVDVAEARGWKALRDHRDRGLQAPGLAGGDGPRRAARWATSRPRRIWQLVERERAARQHNRIEPVRDAGRRRAAGRGRSEAKGTTGRGGGGRKAVLAALEALLVDRNVPAKQRAAVMAAAEQNLAQRVRNGETHRVKVYDRQAPSQPRGAAADARPVAGAGGRARVHAAGEVTPWTRAQDGAAPARGLRGARRRVREPARRRVCVRCACACRVAFRCTSPGTATRRLIKRMPLSGFRACAGAALTSAGLPSNVRPTADASADRRAERCRRTRGPVTHGGAAASLPTSSGPTALAAGAAARAVDPGRPRRAGTPSFAGKRHWGIVRRHLLHAARQIRTPAGALAKRIYVPEVFNVERADAIRERRNARWNWILREDGAGAAVDGRRRRAEGAASRAASGTRVAEAPAPDLPLRAARGRTASDRAAASPASSRCGAHERSAHGLHRDGSCWTRRAPRPWSSWN